MLSDRSSSPTLLGCRPSARKSLVNINLLTVKTIRFNQLKNMNRVHIKLALKQFRSN